jgi:hypothetical protein
MDTLVSTCSRTFFSTEKVQRVHSHCLLRLHEAWSKEQGGRNSGPGCPADDNDRILDTCGRIWSCSVCTAHTTPAFRSVCSHAWAGSARRSCESDAERVHVEAVVALSRPRTSVCCTAVHVSCRAVKPAVWRRSWRLEAHRVMVVMTRGRGGRVGQWERVPSPACRPTARFVPAPQSSSLQLSARHSYLLLFTCLSVVYRVLYAVECMSSKWSLPKPTSSSLWIPP